MGSERFMPTGGFRLTSTPTISPLPCLPQCKEDFSWPSCSGALVQSKLQSIPSLLLLSADAPGPVG